MNDTELQEIFNTDTEEDDKYIDMLAMLDEEKTYSEAYYNCGCICGLE